MTYVAPRPTPFFPPAPRIKRLGVEPWAYLQDVLTRLPTTTAGQLGELLPDRWQAARPTKMAVSPGPPPMP
jgi:hypothetical protein